MVTSLDRPVGEDEETPFGALLASDDRGPEEEVDILLREDALRRALDELPEQEREVVKLRYGVGGDEPDAAGRDRPPARDLAGHRPPARAQGARRARRRAASSTRSADPAA